MLANTMYLRPGQLMKVYDISRETSVNDHGYLRNAYQRTGEQVRGILSQADTNQAERTKHLWDQNQHSLSHTMVVASASDIRKDDIIASTDETDKAYLVLAVDNVAAMGLSTLVYLEERNDIKG